MSAFEVLALNTSIPQIQAAQAGDSYVMVVNATTPALRITQTGTGDSILVEDAANPDSSPFVVTAAGDVGIGTSSPGYKLTVNAFTGVSGPIGAFKQSAETSAFYGVAVQRSGNDSTLGMAFNSSADAWQISASYASSGAYKPIQLLTSDTVRATLDSSGNLGLGVTPTTGGYGKSFQFTDDSVGTLMTLQSQAINTNDRRLSLTNNAKSSGVGTWAYFNTSSSATMYQQGTGEHRWFTAAPAAGPAISFTQAMTLDASGRLLVGATSASTGARATLTSAAQASGAACADSGILLYSTANLATGEYAPFITWSGNFSNPNRARAAIGAVSSSTSTALDLVFLTRSAADASEIGTGSERARITSGGYFKASNNGSYLSSTGTYHELRTTTDNAEALYVSSASTNGTQYGMIVRTANDQNDATRYFLQCEGAATTRATIRSNGGLANYSANNVNLASDERLKKDISPLLSTWDKLKTIEVVNFRYKDCNEGDPLLFGVIAQQVQPIVPDLVVVTKEAQEAVQAKDAVLDADGNVVEPAIAAKEATPEYYGIREQPMYWLAIKALQEAMARIETLEAKIAALEQGA